MSNNISDIDSYLVSSSINNKSNSSGQTRKEAWDDYNFMENIIPFDVKILYTLEERNTSQYEIAF
ncbi:238_t:CDS:1, partial [Gigaspora margarita]